MPHPYKQFYRRKLPHIQPPNATLFVTFRLKESIPKTVLQQWKQERIWLQSEIKRVSTIEFARTLDERQKARLLDFHRRWFVKFEAILHKEETGPLWMKDPRIADLIQDSLHYRDGKVFRLDAHSIMANHVHTVFKLLLNSHSLRVIPESHPLMYESIEPTLGVIMQSLKGYTAHEANKILNRLGEFWEPESYDHVIRNEAEFDRVIRYVVNNPVKAGLVKNWRDWKWSWRRTTGC
ncbi:MAG: transposase [Pyrinomonadaceae bacterium]